MVPSWLEHLRQHERITHYDRLTKEEIQRFHIGETPPVVRHLIAPSDSAISNRPGLRALLAAVERGEVSDVMSEALDRLSRDQEDIAHIYKRLLYADVTLKTLAEGPIETIHIGLKSTMNALFLADLSFKTRRGLIANVKAGPAPEAAAATAMTSSTRASWRATTIRSASFRASSRISA